MPEQVCRGASGSPRARASTRLWARVVDAGETCTPISSSSVIALPRCCPARIRDETPLGTITTAPAAGKAKGRSSRGSSSHVNYSFSCFILLQLFQGPPPPLLRRSGIIIVGKTSCASYSTSNDFSFSKCLFSFFLFFEFSEGILKYRSTLFSR